MTNMITLEVWQLDCVRWNDGDWSINDQINVGEITVPEFFTTRKLFAELRKERFLPGTWTKLRYTLDDGCAMDGVFYVECCKMPELRLLVKGEIA